MKKVKYLAMLLAAGMFAACSDNLEDTGAGNAGGTTPQGETGYVNISLNLPTTSGGNTRANDNFDDGLAAEYNVNSAIIALFYGADEESAICQRAFQLTKNDFQMSGTATDNITSYYASGVRMINAPTAGQNVYALAILNAAATDYSIDDSKKQNGEDDGTAVLSTTLKVNGVSFSGKLSEIQVSKDYAASIASTADKGSFLMTNAPIASATSFKKDDVPADFKVTTLAPITVYNDKDIAAGSAPANPIYVERAVAKTTVKVNSADGELEIESEVPAYDGATVTFDGWKLQNTNKKYYTVRKVKDATFADWEDWKGYFNEGITGVTTNEINRFFGETANPYRTYWGIDPNYSLISDGDLATNFNIYTNTNEPAQWNSVGNNTITEYNGLFVEYCAENTTIAKAMQDNNLTGVLLKATFTPEGATDGDDFFMLNNFSAIYSNEDFLAVATGALAGSAHDLTEGQTLVRNTSATPAKGSTITDIQGVKNLIQISASGSTSALSDDQATTILTAMGNNIKYYQGGVTYYYATLIEHFGDAQAPIASDLSISDLDKYDEGKHLGRWGVVRNNWYELNITSVSGPGEPDIPEIPEEPADKTSSYINCQINVLSWATRQQNVEL